VTAVTAKRAAELSALDAARAYLTRGWPPVPVPFRSKAPTIPGWPELRLTEQELTDHFADASNVGVLLGEPSRGLVDIDLDAPEALALAPHFLPVTSSVFGRPSKPRSHELYLVQPAPATTRFCDDGASLVELRSTGTQTIFPPSTHPSGEVIAWHNDGDPARVGAAELCRGVRHLAAAALLVRHYPAEGSRHEFALALAGALVRAGWPTDEIGQFLGVIADTAGDGEVRDRARAGYSAERIASGRPATGWTRLEKLIGRDIAQRLRDWLDLIPRAEFTDSQIVAPEWPPQLDDRAFYGLVGDVVRVLEPHTEADPAALLLQFLALFGNAIGRRAHFLVEATEHFTNIFVVLVGTSSKGRKGSSFSQVERLFQTVFPDWYGARIHRGGLSSGEGVIWAVRNPVEKAERVSKRGEKPQYEVTIVDPGISDKRLLIFEPEFATVLRVVEREGNTLSSIIRESWDSGVLASLTKNSPAKATGAHISVIGHVTKDELLRYLTTTEAASGFANRFLFICARRSKFLPEGSVVPTERIAPMKLRLAEVSSAAAEIELLQRDERARSIWHEVYPALSAGQPGLLGCVTARAEAQVLRLSTLYALLDGSAIIREQHLLAALAVWEYAEASARFIFGDALGDPVADQILRVLRESSSGLTRTEISGLFGRHRPAADIERALRALSELGFIRCRLQQTEGRSAEVWVCTEPKAAKQAKNAK